MSSKDSFATAVCAYIKYDRYSSFREGAIVPTFLYAAAHSGEILADVCVGVGALLLEEVGPLGAEVPPFEVDADVVAVPGRH